MNKIEIFRSFKDHPWLCKSFKKLTAADIDFCEKFIIKNNSFNKGDFDLAVNKLFMDERNPPKSWKYIKELLSCTNSTI